jgi:mRNA interferase RelE/StbE
MTYKITFKRSALKELLTLPKIEIARILLHIDQLSMDPRPPGSIKLSGHQDALWRIRIGDYRVLYLIEETIKVVDIRAIGHRKDVY